jgi:CheY-like chemotaxis protein
VLAKQLRNLGCIVEVANHGVEALNHIETTRYCVTTGTAKELSIVLLDWEMPVMDGLTCIRKIRELQLAKSIQGHIPVIGVTANARTQQIDQAMKAGMDDVVSKPFRIPDLMSRINSLLDKLAKA